MNEQTSPLPHAETRPRDTRLVAEKKLPNLAHLPLQPLAVLPHSLAPADCMSVGLDEGYVGLCRTVVTGSYRAAVFALSQGIPIVALAKSEYYGCKFRGLLHQFRHGCNIISLDAHGLEASLLDGIESAWRSAKRTRPKLLEAATRQIALCRAAYARVRDLIATDVPAE